MAEAIVSSSFIDRHGQESLELLAFVTQGELYAVSLSAVQEIVVPPPLTWVPRAPRAVIGVCSVRGRLVTVVDFRICMGFSPQETSRKSRILLGVGAGEEIMGLRVDEVRQVVRLSPSELEMTNQTLGGDISDGVLRGIGRPSGGEELVLVDMKAILVKGCS